MKIKTFKRGDKIRLETGEGVVVAFVFVTKGGQMFHGIDINNKITEYRNIMSNSCRRLRRQRQK